MCSDNKMVWMRHLKLHICDQHKPLLCILQWGMNKPLDMQPPWNEECFQAHLPLLVFFRSASCKLYTDAYFARDMLDTQSMKNRRLSFYVLSECLLEEETSAAAARRLCTLPKKCSVRERAGISPAFCAVSINGFKVICTSRKSRAFGIRTEKASC